MADGFLLNSFGTFGDGGGGGTDWTADSSIRALYSFESGGIALDSTANNNDLTCNNDPTCPDADTTNYKELVQAASFTAAGTDKMYHITQPNMSANMIGNGAGTSSATVAGWVRVTTLSTSDYLWSLYGDSPLTNVFSLYQSDASGTLTFALEGSTGSTTLSPTTTLSASTYYFVGIVYDSTNVYVYIRQDGGGSSEWVSSSASLGDIADITSSGVLAIGARTSDAAGNAFYGQLDGVAIFERAFNQTELDSVFSNGWDGDGW